MLGTPAGTPSIALPVDRRVAKRGKISSSMFSWIEGCLHRLLWCDGLRSIFVGLVYREGLVSACGPHPGPGAVYVL